MWGGERAHGSQTSVWLHARIEKLNNRVVCQVHKLGLKVSGGHNQAMQVARAQKTVGTPRATSRGCINLYSFLLFPQLFRVFPKMGRTPVRPVMG